MLSKLNFNLYSNVEILRGVVKLLAKQITVILRTLEGRVDNSSMCQTIDIPPSKQINLVWYWEHEKVE